MGSTFLRSLTALLVILLVFAAGFFLRSSFSGFGTKTAEEESVLLLERIREVSQWVSVEGYFSEIYDYKDYYTFDFSPFRKKALIRVKAKVLVGFDLDHWSVNADASTRTLRMDPLPQPVILSLEHDLDYYDISEGTFNSFSAADYNELNTKAKDFIRQKAESSDLKARAKAQGAKLIAQIRLLAEAGGWRLEISPASPLMQ